MLLAQLVMYVLSVMREYEAGDAEPFLLWSVNSTSLKSINPTLTWMRGKYSRTIFDLRFLQVMLDWMVRLRPLHRSSSGQNQDQKRVTSTPTWQIEGTHLNVSRFPLDSVLGMSDWRSQGSGRVSGMFSILVCSADGKVVDAKRKPYLTLRL